MATSMRPAPETSTPQQGPVRVERRLPRFAPLGLFLVGIALGAGLSALTDFSVTSTLIYGVIFGTLAVYVATRAVEGRRKATDRLVTCLVTTAFAIAMKLRWSVPPSAVVAARTFLPFMAANLVAQSSSGSIPHSLAAFFDTTYCCVT